MKPMDKFEAADAALFAAPSVALGGVSAIEPVGNIMVMPSSVADAIASLKDIVANASNFDMQAMIMVLALVQPDAGHGGKASSALSAKKFAELGIKSLKSHMSVLKMHQVGMFALAQGVLKEMPSLSFDNGELKQVVVPSVNFKELVAAFEAHKLGAAGVPELPEPKPQPGQFDALAKAIKGMDSAGIASAIKFMAQAIGKAVVFVDVDVDAAVDFSAQDKQAVVLGSFAAAKAKAAKFADNEAKLAELEADEAVEA